MKPIKIDKALLTVNKPSSQISTEYSIHNKPHIITPFQFDAMNYICYQAREQISKKYGLTKKGNHPINKSNDLKIRQIETINGAFKLDDELFTTLRSELIEIDISDLSDFTEKYGNGQKNKLIKAIEELRSVQIKVGYITEKQDDMMITTDYFNMIGRVRLDSNKKVFQIFLEPELIIGWVFNATPHTQLKIKTVAKLKSITSKKLYELLVDYAFKKYNEDTQDRTYSVEFNKLKGILNIPNNTASKVASQLKKNYLIKAIEDINNNTDMTITSNTHIKQKGVVTITFDFNFSEDINEPLSIDDQIKYNKKKVIAKSRLEQSKKFQDINNEEAWLKKTIESITDEYLEEQDKIEQAKIILDELDDESLKIFGKLLMDEYKDVVMIKDYKLQFAFDETKPPITNSAKETYDVLLKLEQDIN
jgi:plasmid replication initiation protein